MKGKITGFLLLLGLSLVLTLWGCAAKPEEQSVSGSFVESEVPMPRIVYTARDGGKMRDLYYIPLTEELADMCREALDDPDKEKLEPLETVQLFHVELDKDQGFTVLETLGRKSHRRALQCPTARFQSRRKRQIAPERGRAMERPDPGGA